jgi:outer membrane translocation and assembly module TamA
MGYREGWIFRGEYEKAGDPFEGDFDFDRVWLQGKRYQRTFGNQQAIVRLMAGLHKGTLPEQKRFDLGGIESLRGYPFKAFTGDRMLLGNVYYLFGGDLLGRSGIPIVQSLQLILFTDTGAAFSRFKGLQVRDLKTDVGLAIADLENTFRVNLAKRLDRSGDSIEITARLLRKF